MKKICVFTGTRADYGILSPLLQRLRDDKNIQLQLLVTGSHLSPEFGLTYKEIENDGFSIDETVEILLSSDTTIGVNKAVGLGLISYGESLKRLNPDLVIILGDRFEAVSFALASTILKIPICHINGGESTIGAIDEAFRHSITKMSHIHFPATEEYRKRIIQLGEHPDRVFNVGALSIDNIKKIKMLNKSEFKKAIGFKLNKKNLLITYHPATLDSKSSVEHIMNLLAVIDEMEDTNLIFTKSNADAGGRIINKLIDEYVERNKEKTISFSSMGQLKYLSAMQFVDAVVGNSSSGLIEAPSFKIGTINIGDRQLGRVKADSVIDCNNSKESIKNAFIKLFSHGFQSILKKVKNPYGDGDTTSKMIGILNQFDLKEILKKEFYDVDFKY